MKILYFTDLHLKNIDIIDVKVMQMVKEIVNSVDCDMIVFGGDIFDSFRVGISNDIFYEVICDIVNIGKIKSIYIVVGNHDMLNGICSYRLYKYYSDKVRIVDGYEYIDDGDIRYHFMSYVKYKKIDYNIDYRLDGGKNVLFSHIEFNSYDDVPDSLRKFDLIVNGHIHDFGIYNKLVNVGSFRKTRNGESNISRYMIMDGINYKIKEIESVIKIEEVSVDEVDKCVDKVDILYVDVGNQSDIDKVREVVKDKNVIVKYNIINNDIDMSINEGVIDKGIREIVNEYCDIYESKFGVDIGKEEREWIIKLFNRVSVNEGFDIRIERVVVKNFKLYEDLEYEFINDKGLVLVKGINRDEVYDINISSNESGKSVFRQIIEYSLLGSDSDISPLRSGCNSGMVSIDFRIKKGGVDDSIKIVRYFGKKNEVEIFINGVEWNANLTNTDKINLFFEMYDIKWYIIFISVYENDYIRMLFNNRSNMRNKILNELFPYIFNDVSKFVQLVKDEYKGIESNYKKMSEMYSNYVKDRSSRAGMYYKMYKDFMVEKKNVIDRINELECMIKSYEGYEVKSRFSINDIKNLSKYIEVSKRLKDGEIVYIDGSEISMKVNNHRRFEKYFTFLNKYGIDRVSKYINDKKNGRYEIYKKLKDYEKLLNEKRLRYKELKNSDMKVCMYCGSVLSDNERYRQHIESELERISSEGKMLLEEYNRLKDMLGDFDVNEYEKNEREIRISDVDMKVIMSVDNIYDYYDKDYEKHVEELNFINKNNILYELYEEMKRYGYDKIDIEEEIKLIEESNRVMNILNKYRSEVSVLRSNLEYIEKRRRNLLDDVKKYNDSSRGMVDIEKLRYYEKEYKMYSNISDIIYGRKSLNFEGYYVSIFLKKIEDVMNKLLVMVFNKDVKININVNEVIFYEEGNVRLYNDFSSGAKTKINVVLMLSLMLVHSNYGYRCNLMYIDEFLDKGIDDVNILRLIEMIKSNLKYVDVKYLISHKSIDEYVDKIINVVRENNRSVIVESVL